MQVWGAEVTRESSLSPDRERWAEALAVERMHGDQAGDFIAERIATLGSVGDVAGVARWTDIADRLMELQRAGGVS